MVNRRAFVVNLDGGGCTRDTVGRRVSVGSESALVVVPWGQLLFGRERTIASLPQSCVLMVVGVVSGAKQGRRLLRGVVSGCVSVAGGTVHVGIARSHPEGGAELVGDPQPPHQVVPELHPCKSLQLFIVLDSLR